jgi:hypothetical protein
VDRRSSPTHQHRRLSISPPADRRLCLAKLDEVTHHQDRVGVLVRSVAVRTVIILREEQIDEMHPGTELVNARKTQFYQLCHFNDNI